MQIPFALSTAPKMLKALVKNNGLAKTFDAVISVDDVKIFKPDPKVYQLAPKKLKVKKNEIGSVSSNFWDVCGAASFGFRTFWINRVGNPQDELSFKPYAVVSTLTDLIALVSRSATE